MIHVYGVVEQLQELPPLTGVDGAPLERREVNGLELVVSDVAREDVTQEAVLRHAQVVEGLMSRSEAVLPAQYGRPFGDESELAEAIRTKTGQLERGLDRVRGCVELGLRVAGPSESPATKSGTEYMRARLAEEQVLAKLDEPLARLSRASTRGAYLVPVESVEVFHETVCRLQAENPKLTIVCTGPWPPYSFGAEDA